jgi:uncharacterized protein (TIGR02996 family)
MARKRVASPETGFLQEIIAQPGDDGPRLVFADWLEDNGDPRRAEFIRLQCRLAAMDEDDPSRDALVDREWELLQVYRERWLPRWSKWALEQEHEYHRGFVATLSVTANKFQQSGSKLIEAAPLEELHLRIAGGLLRHLLNDPRFSRLTALNLRDNLVRDKALEALISCPHLTGLRRLDLARTRLRLDDMYQLAAWPGLARLTHLCLFKNDLNAEKLAPLLGSRYLTNLVSLDLSYNHRLGQAGAALLAESPRLRTLTHLHLRGCDINAEGVAALVKGNGLGNLRCLDLGDNSSVQAAGAEILAASPLLGQLTSLDLRSCALHNDGLAALAASPYLDRLRCLVLSWNDLGEKGMVALARAQFSSLVKLELGSNRNIGAGISALRRSPCLGGLTSLSLSACGLGGEETKALTASLRLPLLTHLNLNFNRLQRTGTEALACWSGLSTVRHLHLNSNEIADDGARALASCTHLSQVRHLHLESNRLTDESARALAQSTRLRELRQLVLDWNKDITQEGFRTLAASPNLPRLLHLQRSGDVTNEYAALLREHGKGIEL